MDIQDDVSYTYSSEFFQKILRNKFIAVVGDSVMRCIYKDLILLLQHNRLLTTKELREKAEDVSDLKDRLLHRTEKTNGKEFEEVREMQTDFHVVQYFFTTRCYNSFMENVLKYWKTHERPDIVIMNSCLWDISRYGYDETFHCYTQNLAILCSRIRETIAVDGMFVWLTALPVSSHISAGFLTNEVKLGEQPLRVAVLNANRAAAQVLNMYGFDVLDVHHFMKSMIKLRGEDGVHWNEIAHRHITELIISFLVDTYDIALDDPAKNKLCNVQEWVRAHNPAVPSYIGRQLKHLETLAMEIQPPIVPQLQIDAYNTAKKITSKRERSKSRDRRNGNRFARKRESSRNEDMQNSVSEAIDNDRPPSLP